MRRETVEEAIAASGSFREAARRVGIPNQGQRLKKVAAAWGIDSSHFHQDDYERMVGKKYGMLTVLAVKRYKRN